MLYSSREVMQERVKFYVKKKHVSDIDFVTYNAGWELLRDPIGRDHFLTFLEREYATGR